MYDSETGDCRLLDQDRHTMAGQPSFVPRENNDYLEVCTKEVAYNVSFQRYQSPPFTFAIHFHPCLYPNKKFNSSLVYPVYQWFAHSFSLAYPKHPSNHAMRMDKESSIIKIFVSKKRIFSCFQINCINGSPKKLCLYDEVKGKILKTVDSVFQGIASREDCEDLCNNAPFRCHSYDFNDTGENVCR